MWVVEFQHARTNYVAVGTRRFMLPVYVVLPGGRSLARAGDLWYPACYSFMPYIKVKKATRRRSATWVRKRWGKLPPHLYDPVDGTPLWGSRAGQKAPPPTKIQPRC
ncbi:MAG: hypothetical protein OXN97_07980 [Bryobacterales bacterium]|nr:hypothetical protein [Bryobacterales bacterium]